MEAYTMTTNKKVLQFVDEAVALAKPDKVVWIDGSEAQLEALRKEAIASGEMINSTTKNCRAAYITVRNPTTSLASRAGLSFAAEEKKTQVPPTTGWIPKKCTKNSKPSRKTA